MTKKWLVVYFQEGPEEPPSHEVCTAWVRGEFVEDALQASEDWPHPETRVILGVLHGKLLTDKYFTPCNNVEGEHA